MTGNLKLFELKSGRGEKLMKNILIISSSPRKKGNSQILCEQFKKGAEAKKQCNVSCIGCGICEKTCTAGAIKVKDNCAVIEESICLSCGMCAVKCPRHVIHDLHGILTEIR